MTVLCWFRRDLRLRDNMALNAAKNSGQQVVPVFIFDPAILESDRIGAPRLKFMLSALESLRTDLHKHQRDILIRQGDTLNVLREIINATGADALYFNRDYTPFARRRDAEIADALEIRVEAFDDRMMIPPGELLKNDGDPYVVYTPFKTKWRTLQKPAQIDDDDDISADWLHRLDDFDVGAIPTLDDLGFGPTIDVPDASEAAAHARLNGFLDDAIYDYDEGRNRLGNPHTEPHTGSSFLSPYIRFGLISTRTIYWACRDAYSRTRSQDRKESVGAFVDEIIWHEFYTHILWHFPQVKTKNFYEKYDTIQWRNNSDHLDAWKNGLTGYPVVDAAMRQLKAVGWMHNRARMIVASFLTKDLLIDWREGELYFMQWLLDGDLAANNGGWQWAAGTGTDAQPYFRIFNPVSQSKKYDPDGAFIRRWVPELRDVPDRHIHTPWKMDAPPADYPAPIVDHKAARETALEVYKAATS